MELVVLDDHNFETYIKSSDTPIFIDLWAEWCPPCIVVAPILKKIVGNYEEKISLAKIEVDEGENMKIAGRLKVRGFPTVILFLNGEEQGRFSGAKSRSEVKAFIDALIALNR